MPESRRLESISHEIYFVYSRVLNRQNERIPEPRCYSHLTHHAPAPSIFTRQTQLNHIHTPHAKIHIPIYIYSVVGTKRDVYAAAPCLASVASLFAGAGADSTPSVTSGFSISALSFLIVVSSAAAFFSSLFSSHFAGLAHSASRQGPASLFSQPPSHSHVPPNSLGRFSAGTCCSSSLL